MKLLQDIDAVIVDLDGTMVDTLGDFDLALNRMLADFKLPAVNRAFIEATVGKGSEHLIRSTLEHVRSAATDHQKSNQDTLSAIAFDDAWKVYQKHYLACNGQASEVYPGAREGLETLRHLRLPMACLTNKPLNFALPLLKTKGLDHYFLHVFGGDSFERKKPDPLPLIKTCEALRSAPERTLMIGDSSNDAQAAYAAGCPAVLVTYGYNHGEDIRKSAARSHVENLAEISN